MTRTPPDGISTTVLPGGLRVVTEAVPGVRSAAFGVWVDVGSRDEHPQVAGASHFLEHLLFKGTERRDALEIAAVMDAVGGEMNAFTAKEQTCFYARVLDTDLPLAVDVVSDLVTSALVTPEDVDSERDVVLEEMAMNDDDPSDVVHDLFASALLGDHPLGQPIIGTEASIERMTRADVFGWYRSRYTPDRMVVSAAGRLDHDEVVELVEKAFAGVSSPPAATRELTVPTARTGLAVDDRQTEQAHLVLGTLGVHRDDPRRYALSVLNNALGGGMSSRLFQEVRERRGLAYSVYSWSSHHDETGLFGVYAGCLPGKVTEVLEVVRAELAAAAERGITAEELQRAKGQMRGSLVLGLEDTGSQMSRIGRSLLVHDDVLAVDELLRRIDAVDLDAVRSVAAEVLSQPMSLAAVGPVGDLRLTA